MLELEPDGLGFVGRTEQGGAPRRTSLGDDWASPGPIAGLISGRQPTSRVTTIHSGETCFFR
ncbi:MAG: hypothetical protein ABIV05_10095 [Actinomycetota bacterium]